MKLYLIEPRRDYISPFLAKFGCLFEIRHIGEGSHTISVKDGTHDDLTYEIHGGNQVIIFDNVLCVSGFIQSKCPQDCNMFFSIRFEGVTSKEHLKKALESYKKYHGGKSPLGIK